MNGARNAPAIAPHDTPIIWAMNAIGLELLYCTSASVAEIAMNTTISARMQSTWLLSLIFLTTVPLMKSIVKVDEDVMTSEESVLIEAESTSTTTSAMSIGESPSSIFGMIAMSMGSIA